MHSVQATLVGLTPRCACGERCGRKAALGERVPATGLSPQTVAPVKVRRSLPAFPCRDTDPCLDVVRIGILRWLNHLQASDQVVTVGAVKIIHMAHLVPLLPPIGAQERERHESCAPTHRGTRGTTFEVKRYARARVAPKQNLVPLVSTNHPIGALGAQLSNYQKNARIRTHAVPSNKTCAPSAPELEKLPK